MKKLPKKIHILGIGGISLSGLALILKNKGHIVTGIDKVESRLTQRLESEGIKVCYEETSDFIYDADLVVVSSAISDRDKELEVARKLNKPIMSRAKLLGIVASNYNKVISIAGSHGKTTTTAMVSKIFLDAGLNPTIHIGGEVGFISGNVHIGGEELFITEACEYVDSFLELKSDVSVILNIQKDHMDYFKTFKNLKKSFTRFSKKTKKNGVVVFCKDDKVADMKYKAKNVSFSMKNFGVVCAKNIREYKNGKYKFDLFILGEKRTNIKLGIYGEHNIYNALASICVALELGIDLNVIKKSLAEFSGVKRRFEDYGFCQGVKVIHDYAHHPTEIRATIEAGKKVVKGRVFVVFQPHTYSRTLSLLNDFVKCFIGVEEVLVYKVYEAREKPSDGIDEKTLARRLAIDGNKAISFDEFKEMKDYLKKKISPNDILLILGAGDIEKFAEFYMKND